MGEPDLVLALDLATQTGWALMDLGGGLVGWGTFKSPPTTKLTRWVRFGRQLGLIANDEIVDRLAVVVFEGVVLRGAKGRRPSYAQLRVAFGLRAIAERWAAMRGIPSEEVSPGQVKKLATGNGSAKKTQVCQAVALIYPDRGFEDLLAADGPWDGSDATAVGLAYLELQRRASA